MSVLTNNYVDSEYLKELSTFKVQCDVFISTLMLSVNDVSYLIIKHNFLTEHFPC